MSQLAFALSPPPATSTQPRVEIVALGPDGLPHPHAPAALGGRAGLAWTRAEASAQLLAIRNEIAWCRLRWRKLGETEERFAGLRLELAEVPR